MLRSCFYIVVLQVFVMSLSQAQGFTTTEEILKSNDRGNRRGDLNIYQNSAIDSLINRYILYNLRMDGMEGYRIQIYSSSNKNAREESGKVRQEFITKFPDIRSEVTFDQPSYYKVRVGNYRTRVEGTKYLLMVRKVFPDAYLVPDIISFPDLNKK